MKAIFNPTSSPKLAAIPLPNPLPGKGFDVVATASDNVIAFGSSSPSTVQDRNVTTYTGATTDHQWDLALQETAAGTLGQGYEVTNLVPGVASIDAQLRVTRVANGMASFSIMSRSLIQRVTKTVELAVSREVPATTILLDSYVTGSLAKHCSDYVDAAIAGKTASVAKPVYSAQDHANAVYVRNASSWLAGVDLTCASPWNSYGANTRAGTLISPRHIAMANHYLIADGTTIRFIKMDGTVVGMTLTTSMQVGTTDIRIGVLSADVPAGISFAKVMPKTAGSKLPSLSYSYRIPAVAFDQEEKALITELAGMDSWMIGWSPLGGARLAFYEDLIGGDSGSPLFLIIGGEPVLLTTWLMGGGGAGPSFITNYDAINAAMTTLGGGYQLTDADLSGFTTY
jgi:hypothetical protein